VLLAPNRFSNFAPRVREWIRLINQQADLVLPVLENGGLPDPMAS
jgi:hypothetical protein